MALTKEDNLIIQSMLTSSLLIDLSFANKEFIKSEFFKGMHAYYPKVKENFLNEKIPIGNEGTALMLLYALLVIPRELISETYKKEYGEINAFLAEKAMNVIDTYKVKNDFLRHIRNAVSHAKVEFEYTTKSKMITFKDKHGKNEVFSAAFDLNDISILIADKLFKIHQKYMEDISDRNKE